MRVKLWTVALVLVVAYLSVCRAMAGNIVKGVVVTNPEIILVEGQVDLSFDIVVTQIKTSYQFTAIPVLYQGGDSVMLPPIVVEGKKHKIAEQRVQRMQAHPDQIQIPVGTTLHYSWQIPYRNWMEHLSFRLEPSVMGCCRPKKLPDQEILSDVLLVFDPTPIYDSTPLRQKLSALEQYDLESAFLYPYSEYPNRHEIFEAQRDRGALKVYFRQGRSRIDSEFQNNQQTLEEIYKALDMIEADPTASLKKVVIFGLASPEGTLAANTVLAEKRADALKYYMGERVAYDPELFELINGSEDWEGLRRLVEASRMSGRWQVLEIIDRYSITGGRETKLMELNRGDPYRYMAEHFFPQLRNAGYIQVYYDAESNIDPDIEKFNQALQHMSVQQYDEALQLLLSIKGKSRTDNLIGVCYMMTDCLEEAEEFLTRAAAREEEDAKQNIIQLRQLQNMKKK